MLISIIAALDKKRGIGIGNRLPWRLSADLKKFRALTMGHHVIVGRKTFESIGRPLPGRRMIIVTRDKDLKVEGCFVVHSIDDALELARSNGETEVFICGGAEIYAASLEFADRMYLTLVEAEVEADAFFPGWDARSWEELESFDQAADEKNQYAFRFVALKRRKRGA